ncbi:MAG: chorismate mutase [Actinoplanes sp.]|jgi:hypothetical protein|nr:chorismate mutase [Actinoplanes sp.]MDT5041156.1 chorismate mutase [Actinoplanes sp.]
MSDQVLVLDAEAPLGFLPDEPTLEHLDQQLVALILYRAEQGRKDELARRMQGLPVRHLISENEMVRRFAAQLGERGCVIAAAVLALSRNS